jgi:plastocyanin
VIRNGARDDEAGMRHPLFAALAGAALLAGCGGSDDGGGSATAATDTIRIKEFLYSPKSATVKAGQAISVPNADDAPHTLTDRSPKREFDSGTIKGDATGKVTFRRAGTFEYFCELHPYMKGTVTVTR